MSTRDAGRVTDLMMQVAGDEVLPRFGALAAADIAEKRPGDLVTVADRLAEERLTEGLTALLPGSLVVGEEAVHADPEALRRLDGDAPVWIVDPVDGTGAFVRGDERFCMLVALAQAGTLLASWTYAPALGILATARRGEGAVCDGRPVRVPEHRADAGPLRLHMSDPEFLTPAQGAMLARLHGPDFTQQASTSAGLDYVDLVRGDTDGLVYAWESPWDHAAGLLLVAEAGGVSATLDGAPFKLAGGNALPLVVAAHEDVAADLAKRLIG
ncbi:inositol monophosphatase family protein [Yinghuangia soli]|uniref:inositol-phosphate phosphatase n=1 Tax=Yinghuangia soli TaxID=2908204 RepID=A0AA41U487_9ACTN|nr:inositol monophosphatase [Yinghuangia soli]MCF2528809.1 inositol monophosphatase [Yinghuangia soli]